MKKKILFTVSLFWIIFVGYLVWANGLASPNKKAFRWDEWIWFGLIPAIAPYLFYLIWKPDYIKNFLVKKK